MYITVYHFVTRRGGQDIIKLVLPRDNLQTEKVFKKSK